MGKQWKLRELWGVGWGYKITADGDCHHEVKRHLLLGRRVMTNLDSILKSKDVTLPTKVHLAKAVVFPVVMYECESWTIERAECQRIYALGRTLERPLYCKEIQLVHPKWNQSWIFIGRTDTEAETPMFWPRDAKNLLIGKDPDDGKDWSQEEKGTRGIWDGWMTLPTWWTWVWTGSRSWWRTGKPGVLMITWS